MISFNTAALVSLTIGGTSVDACLWSRPYYGLFSGLIQSVITIAIKELFGEKASALYLTGVGVYLIGNEFLKYRSMNDSKTLKIKTKFWRNEDRKAIYQETMKCIEQGHYISPKQERVDLKLGFELSSKSKSIELDTKIADLPSKYTTRIIVVNQDCLEAAEEQVKNNRKVAVVNFASHDNPGRNSDTGTNGQEEDLCYRSELAGFMADQKTAWSIREDFVFYPLRVAMPDHLIHTPDVLVFRASRAKSYAVLSEPFRVGIVTADAPLKPELSGEYVIDYAKEEDKLRVRNSIMTQLHVAYEEGYDTVILGAFGCGYYKNPPQAVAKIYKEVIDTSFKGAFQQIIFAILDDPLSKGPHNPTGNFKPFAWCFNA